MSPAAITPKQPYGPPIWRQAKHARLNSTLQESRDHGGNVGLSAVLHGTPKNHGQKTQPKDSQTQPPHPPTPKGPAQTKSHKGASSQKSKSRQQHTPQTRGKKRKAEANSDQHPAKRRGRIQLQDEAHIRSTMHIPTPQEYPELPNGFFKNIKASICDRVQGLAELRSDCINLSGDTLQCTLHFTSASHQEIVIGEGRSKVMSPPPSS